MKTRILYGVSLNEITYKLLFLKICNYKNLIEIACKYLPPKHALLTNVNKISINYIYLIL